jgi:class 3 adenylate cyclase
MSVVDPSSSSKHESTAPTEQIRMNRRYSITTTPYSEDPDEEKFLTEYLPCVENLQSRLYTHSGWLGKLERIPLWMKLVLCVSISFITVVVFGTVLVKDRTETLAIMSETIMFSNMTLALSNFVNELQRERSSTGYFLAQRQDIYWKKLLNQRFRTDRRLKEFRYAFSEERIRAVRSLDNVIQKINYCTENLNTHRSLVNNMQIEVSYAVEHYTTCNEKLIDAISAIALASQDTIYLNNLNTFNFLVRYKEATMISAEILSAFGMSQGKFSLKFYQQFVAAISLRNAFFHLMELSMDDQLRKLVQIVFNTDHYKRVQIIEDSVLGMDISAIHNYTIDTDADSWYNSFSCYLEKLKVIEDRLADDILSLSYRLEHTASNQAYTYCLMVLVAFVTTIIIAAGLSRTIIEPWKRVLKIQEDTILAIGKYIPVGFLKLLDREDITEMQLGDFSTREMEILFLDIRGFTSISEDIGPHRTFEFLNSYLRWIAPLFRKHNGFIDSYIGDGLLALFLKLNGSSIEAAIEVQRRIKKFNQEHKVKFPQIEVGIGINSGYVIAGLVGSEGRIQATIISDAVNTSSRLEQLCKRYSCKILVSREALQNCQSTSPILSRYIGCTKLAGKKVDVHLYQIFDPSDESDLRMWSTIVDFKEGVTCMFQEPYDLARAACCFQRVVSAVPSDKTARIRLAQCLELIADPDVLNGWHGVEIISKQ